MRHIASMPFDAQPGTALNLATRDRAVAWWLLGLTAMIFGMVLLGGATRLTGSGLSIMEWAPLSGIVPPLSHAEWERLFALYRTTDQYRLLNAGFGLAGFQHIFWLEWTHRLWGRLTGVVLLAPLVWLLWSRRIDRRLAARLAILFVLGGLQGAIGWFMVRSGFFPDQTAVAPTRLALHLGLGLLLYACTLWLALDAWRVGMPPSRSPRSLRIAAGVALGAAACTIVAGGLTAGLHAGLIDETFPLMDGHLIPPGYAAQHPFWRNLIANAETVQFDHRLLATLTALASLATLAAGLRVRLSAGARSALLALGGLVVLQYALGIATLLSGVRTGLALAHQAGAMLVLTSLIVLLAFLSPPRQDQHVGDRHHGPSVL
jgi:heme a synthase